MGNNRKQTRGRIQKWLPVTVTEQTIFGPVKVKHPTRKEKFFLIKYGTSRTTALSKRNF